MLPSSFELYTASYEKILERTYKKSVNRNEHITVLINDKYGHTYSGFIVNLDLEKGIVALHSKNDDLTYLLIDNVVSISIQDFSSHLESFSKNNRKLAPSSHSSKNEPTNERIKKLEAAIFKNIDTTVKFKATNIETLNEVALENIYCLFESLFSNLIDIGSDDFGKELISKTGTFEVENTNNQHFSIAKDSNRIIIKYCSTEKIPSDYHSTIKRKLENLL